MFSLLSIVDQPKTSSRRLAPTLLFLPQPAQPFIQHQIVITHHANPSGIQIPQLLVNDKLHSVKPFRGPRIGGTSATSQEFSLCKCIGIVCDGCWGKQPLFLFSWLCNSLLLYHLEHVQTYKATMTPATRNLSMSLLILNHI